MANAGLLAINPASGGFDSWLKIHQDDHNRVAAKTKTDHIILDPFAKEVREARLVWLQDHQRAHDQVNAYLGIAGADLRELDFENEGELASWVDLNSLEHAQWSNSIP